MKILLSSYVFSPSVGGIETVSELLAPEFVRAGHEVILITRTIGEDGIARPYPVERRPGILRMIELVRWCDVYFQNNISLHMAWPLLFLRRPWIIAHHTWLGESPRRRNWKAQLKRHLLRHGANATISRPVACDLPLPSTIVGNPYYKDIFRERPEIARDRELVYLGRLVSDKGVDMILKSLEQLRTQGLTPRLSIIGSGSEERHLRRIVARKKLENQVEFLGEKKPPEIALLLNAHQVMVVPSRCPEPFGIVALEGIASGCIIVASDAGGLPEAVGPCGLTFALADQEDLTRSLHTILTRPELCARLRQDAATHLRQFEPATVAGRYLDIFERSLHPPPDDPMQVTYTSPNRSHHYLYAAALARAGCLHCFVSGFSRFSPRAALPQPEMEGKLLRADHLQNLYLASLRLKLPAPVSAELAFLSKKWLDRLSEKPARASDLFLFYSGAGLRTARRLEGSGVVRVAEAVNCHVRVQERIMREEHRRLDLPPPRFHPRETARRIEEYQIAEAILCPSTFVKKSFEEEGIAPDRVHVVPYGIALQPQAEASQHDPETFRVLYVGQISPRKGLRYLFEAFGQLRHPRKELWIVGPTAQPTGIEGLAPPDGTRFPGVLKGEALARAYQEADVFVLPTVEEGLALVLGEALSFGLPVVTTDQSGGADLFTDDREGFLVPVRSPGAIAEKLQLLADDPAARARMSEAARARARSLRGWEETGEKLIETLSALAAFSHR